MGRCSPWDWPSRGCGGGSRRGRLVGRPGEGATRVGWGRPRGPGRSVGRRPGRDRDRRGSGGGRRGEAAVRGLLHPDQRDASRPRTTSRSSRAPRDRWSSFSPRRACRSPRARSWPGSTPRRPRPRSKIAQVALQDAERIYRRAQETFAEQLISQADYDAALAAKESAEATLFDRQVQLDYTEVKAPFGAVVVDRTSSWADNVTAGQVLFRISDFDPLLSKIQVPEKELSRLHKGQPAYLTVEAWPGERFPARVLRAQPGGGLHHRHHPGHPGGRRAATSCGRGCSPTSTSRSTRHEDALTIPKSALSLESLGDTVYVVNGDVAARRPIQLGYEEADIVEVASGLEEGDRRDRGGPGRPQRRHTHPDPGGSRRGGRRPAAGAGRPGW